MIGSVVTQHSESRSSGEERELSSPATVDKENDFQDVEGIRLTVTKRQHRQEQGAVRKTFPGLGTYRVASNKRAKSSGTEGKIASRLDQKDTRSSGPGRKTSNLQGQDLKQWTGRVPRRMKDERSPRPQKA